MKEYKNGYLLTDEEHDFALKHKHEWVEVDTNHVVIAQCECGAAKWSTPYGIRVYISMSPNRGPRYGELNKKSFWSKIFG